MSNLITIFFETMGLDLQAPTSLAELFPWLVVVLFCAGFVGALFKLLILFAKSFRGVYR